MFMHMALLCLPILCVLGLAGRYAQPFIGI